MSALPAARRGSIPCAVRLLSPAEQPPPGPDRRRQLLAQLCRMIVEGADAPPPPTVESLPAVKLSPRMRQVLDRLLAGDSEKQIAPRIGCSQHTVHTYVKTIYRRFGVCSRGELLARFVDRRAPPPAPAAP